MKNKNTLIGTATLMICLAVAIVLAVFVISTPKSDLQDTNEPSPDFVAEASTDSSRTDISAENTLSADETSEGVESSEAPYNPELILPPETVLHSNIALVYSYADDAVIFERDSEVQTAPASLTKLVTALVALDHLSPTRRITVGEEINLIGENSSIAFLAVGQKYTVKSLLDGLLIPSGNDAAYVLAVNAARVAANDMTLNMQTAITDFVRLMNEKVSSLGCVSTHFMTPDGYDAEGQLTTASDMLKICKAAMNNSNIQESVAKGKSGGWLNSNLLVREDSSLYNPDVTGLKTGSTSGAGYCVAVSAVVEQKTYIMVFMNSTSSDGRFRDANTIIKLIKNEIGTESSEETAEVSEDSLATP